MSSLIEDTREILHRKFMLLDIALTRNKYLKLYLKASFDTHKMTQVWRELIGNLRLYEKYQLC